MSFNQYSKTNNDDISAKNPYDDNRYWQL